MVFEVHSQKHVLLILCEVLNKYGELDFKPHPEKMYYKEKNYRTKEVFDYTTY